MSALEATLARLAALHPKLIDLSLDRMWRILEALDHPERRLPPVIHVAGTNGKGSTIAFMRAMLEAAGKGVHVYTSPHLVRFNERFRVAAAGGGRFADDDTLNAALLECEEKNGGAPITIFEITTAAGLLLFSRNPADILLLEVGLGGRLDATNVIDKPFVSVITPVSLDHAEHLGTTLADVAGEKAGIIKRGVPVVVSPQAEEALTIIVNAAERLRAPLHAAGEHWMAGEEHGRLVYQDEDGLLDLPTPRLAGRHQTINAATAIAALRTARLRLPPSAFENGLLKVDWPARMQRLKEGALADMLPSGSELWLDGGHNPDGGRAIAAALADLEERVPRPLVIVTGMLSTKDATSFLSNFSGLAARLYGIAVPHQQNSLPAEAIVVAAQACGIPAEPAEGLADALSRIAQSDIPPSRVLITGSLYLAGEVLKENGTPPV